MRRFILRCCSVEKIDDEFDDAQCHQEQHRQDDEVSCDDGESHCPCSHLAQCKADDGDDDECWDEQKHHGACIVPAPLPHLSIG